MLRLCCGYLHWAPHNLAFLGALRAHTRANLGAYDSQDQNVTLAFRQDQNVVLAFRQKSLHSFQWSSFRSAAAPRTRLLSCNSRFIPIHASTHSGWPTKNIYHPFGGLSHIPSRAYRGTSHRKTHPPRTLQQADAQGPTVLGGGGRVLISEVPLYMHQSRSGPTPRLSKNGACFAPAVHPINVVATGVLHPQENAYSPRTPLRP